MSTSHNHAPIQNQAGHQIVHGNVIFNDRGGPHKRSRFGYDDPSSEKSLDDDILAKLAFPQISDRRRDVEAPHHRTCEWLFELDEYKNWKAEPRGLLWIKGSPGAGKSTVMSHLYSTLWRERRVGVDICLEFFFTARGTPLQRTPMGMFRSLLNQLFYHDLRSRSFIRKLYQEKKTSFGSGDSAWEWQLPELKTLFKNTISACAQHSQIVIFIDALDEAGQQAARDIAHYFHNLNDHIDMQAGAVKICIACRHYPVPSTARSIEVYVERYNRGDIEAYIRDYLRLDNLSLDLVSQKEAWLKLLKNLVDMARGIFQWAHLVVSMVGQWMSDGYTPKLIYERLALVPKELKNLYEHIIKNVIDDHHRTQSLRLFQWVCLAKYPLSVTQMRYALAAYDIAIEAGTSPSTCQETTDFVTSDKLMRFRIKSWSGGLVETAPDYDGFKIQLIHQSVNEFLRADGLRLLYSLGSNAPSVDRCNPPHIKVLESIQMSHSILYSSCLKYLCSLRDFGPSGTEARLRWPLLEYAAECFLEHAQKAGAHRSEDLHSESRLLNRSLPARDLAANDDQFWKGSLFYLLKGAPVLHLAAAAGWDDVVRHRIECHDDLGAQTGQGWTALHFAAREGHLSVAQVLVDAGADLQQLTKGNNSPLSLAAGRGHIDLFSWLMSRGASINAQCDARCQNSKTPLYAAAEQSQLAMCKLCIEVGADVNAQGGHYGNALQAAVSKGIEEVVRILLDAGADVNAQGRYYDNALQAAVSEGTEKVVRILLDAGADVNAQGGHYGNALQLAALTGKEEVVGILLDAGADVNAQGGIYSNVLQAAVSEGTEEIVHILLDAGADVNARGGHYGDALQVAALTDKEEVVDILLDAGADVNAQGGKYGNALQAAVSEGIEEVVRILLYAGADVNAQGGEYGSALQAAAYSGSEEVVRLLLESGANINAQGGKYGNALQAAVSKGSKEVVRILLDAGADFNAQGGDYSSALQAAASRGEEKVVRMLLDAGADVNAQGGRYGSALQAAVSKGSKEVIRILLDAGADVNAQGGDYGNALQVAASRDSKEVVCILLDAGADVNAQGGKYGNALQAAVVDVGREEVVRILLDAGADVNAQGGHYGNALYAAVSEGTEKVVRILLDAGADVNAQGGFHSNALQAAAFRGLKEVVRILIDAGADVNAQ